MIDSAGASLGGLVDGMAERGFRSIWARSESEALSLMAIETPDLVIVPTVHVFRLVRRRSDVPVIVVGRSDSEVEATVALELGADDYVSHPYALREVAGRAQAVLRRTRRQADRLFLRVDDIVVDRQAHRVEVGDREVALTVKEFGILELLLENAGSVVTRRSFIDRLWGNESTARPSHLDSHIRRLRTKVEGGGAVSSRITTIRGLGYRYDPDPGPERPFERGAGPERPFERGAGPGAANGHGPPLPRDGSGP